MASAWRSPRATLTTKPPLGDAHMQPNSGQDQVGYSWQNTLFTFIPPLRWHCFDYWHYLCNVAKFSWKLRASSQELGASLQEMSLHCMRPRERSRSRSPRSPRRNFTAQEDLHVGQALLLKAYWILSSICLFSGFCSQTYFWQEGMDLAFP